MKFDGYRMHARLDRGVVQLLTRTGLDWTHKYPAIAAAVATIEAKQAYFDGELCGVRPDGTTSFSMIQLASDSGNAAALVFFLFDLRTSTVKTFAHGHFWSARHALRI
jgi:ATP-dependent DNA ligase